MEDIYIKCPEKFKPLICCPDGFHMAECLQHCIGKYIKDTGLEDALVESKPINKKQLNAY